MRGLTSTSRELRRFVLPLAQLAGNQCLGECLLVLIMDFVYKKCNGQIDLRSWPVSVILVWYASFEIFKDCLPWFIKDLECCGAPQEISRTFYSLLELCNLLSYVYDS